MSSKSRKKRKVNRFHLNELKKSIMAWQGMPGFSIKCSGKIVTSWAEMAAARREARKKC